jgi:hypothetical protein
MAGTLTNEQLAKIRDCINCEKLTVFPSDNSCCGRLWCDRHDNDPSRWDSGSEEVGECGDCVQEFDAAITYAPILYETLKIAGITDIVMNYCADMNSARDSLSNSF